MIYFVQNKIGKIDEGALDWAKETLTSLELGGNRIRVSDDAMRDEVVLTIQAIENLESLTLLNELWLGKNKIRTLEV